MPLELIGAGLGRTGTMSLKFALEQLGFGPCHHMIELIQHPETASLWERAAAGEAVDWEEVLAGYRAAVDWPACHFYRELAARYPAAKIILTVREPQSWYESTQATIFHPQFLRETEQRASNGIVQQAILPAFEHRMHDRDHMIAVYERHNAEVRRRFPPERLLVFDVCDGWGPICRFLGVPVPAQPFPRANTTDAFIKRRTAEDGT